jgi:hypothetical protein
VRHSCILRFVPARKSQYCVLSAIVSLIFSLYGVGLPDVAAMLKEGFKQHLGGIKNFCIDMKAAVINGVKHRVLTSVYRGIYN